MAKISKKIQTKKPEQEQRAVSGEVNHSLPVDNSLPAFIHTIQHSKYAIPIGLVLILIWVFLLYLPSLWAQPFMDDYDYILKNDLLKDPANVGEFLSFFYVKRGLNQLTYMFDYWFYGQDLWGFHLTSILFHLIAVVFAYETCKQVYLFLYDRYDCITIKWISLCTAFLFGILPINTQPVSYLTSRANIIAVLFFLVGLSAALYLLRKSNFWSLSLSKKIVIYISINIIVYGSVFIGLGGKEIVVTLPIVFLVSILCSQVLHKKWITFGLFAMPLLIGGIAYAMIRLHVFNSLLGIPDSEVRSPYVNILTQFCVIHLYYLYKIIFPVELFLDPVFPEIHSLFHPYIWSALAIFLSMIAAAFFVFRKHPIIVFGLLWFYITLAPTSSLIPLWDIIAERRVYLSSIGLMIIIPYTLYHLYLHKKITLNSSLIMFLSLSVYFSVFCMKRNIEMTSAVETWKKEVEYYPSNPRAFQALMFYYLEDGEEEKARQLFMHYDLQEIDPNSRVNDLQYYNNIIKYMMNYGIKREQCERNAEMLVEYFPNHVDFMNTLQTAYLLNGKTDKAREVIGKILQKDRSNLIALQHKALLLSQENKHEEALAALHLAVQANPDSLVALTQLVNYLDFLGHDTTEHQQRMNALQSAAPKNDKIFTFIE